MSCLRGFLGGGGGVGGVGIILFGLSSGIKVDSHFGCAGVGDLCVSAGAVDASGSGVSSFFHDELVARLCAGSRVRWSRG